MSRPPPPPPPPPPHGPMMVMMVSDDDYLWTQILCHFEGSLCSNVQAEFWIEDIQVVPWITISETGTNCMDVNYSSSPTPLILFVRKPQLDLPDYNSPRLVEAPLYNHSIARLLQQYLRLLTTGKATNGITTKGTTTIKKQHSIAQPHL